MKKVVILFSIFMASTTFLFAQQIPARTLDKDVIEGRRAPTPDEAKLMKVEETNNADIYQATQGVDAAINSLKKTNNDYGGYKAQAMTDLQQAYISLRKAVYYRLSPEKHK